MLNFFPSCFYLKILFYSDSADSIYIVYSVAMDNEVDQYVWHRALFGALEQCYIIEVLNIDQSGQWRSLSICLTIPSIY